MSGEFSSLLNKLLARRPPEAADIRSAFDAILAGAWTPVQVGAFAIALRMHEESAETLTAAVQAMRKAMTPVRHDLPLVMDTCGTGGDGVHTLNLSSAAAVLVAACGVPVAKHGNRSVSSRCGSADVFEAMGIPLDVPPERQGAVMHEAGIAFLFAPTHHPALRHAGQARKELGVRTLFNIVGPLANPALATHQLVGVYEDRLRPLMAEALGFLGVKRAWVVRGEDGLDEVSPCGPTRVSELGQDGHVFERVVSPEDFGVSRMNRSALAGGDARENAEAIRAILEGKPHPAREAVVLNAAAALCVATGEPPRACTEKVRHAIENQLGSRTFEHWKRAALRVREG